MNPLKNFEYRNWQGKSLREHPIIQPGNYDGLWSGYFVEILFEIRVPIRYINYGFLAY